MKFQLFDRVVLKVDVPDARLEANDIVTVVEFLEARRDLPNAYCVEAFNAIGETIAVFTVSKQAELNAAIFKVLILASMFTC